MIGEVKAQTEQAIAADDTPARQRESALIRRAQQRDAAAMRELVDAHKDRLFAFVWRMVRHHHDAEEFCQDAFLKAFANLNTFDTRYRFSTWLFTIAYRLTLNQIRRKRPAPSEMDFSVIADPEESAETRSASSEEARRLQATIWQAVDRLSPPQRAAILLFYRQQCSCQDIGEILEMPVATVKSHLHRGRCRLKEHLEAVVDSDSSTLCILRELAG